MLGAVYALSGKLWLAAPMHANTDYPLSRLVSGDTMRFEVGFVSKVASLSRGAGEA